ncbi:MAG: hypothetical protein KF838_01965 [Phycisphaeraceae bacterium]|nr:MAG: hypothetical protein KF838_01965 [Phycisphaeraceae bacterium]
MRTILTLAALVGLTPCATAQPIHYAAPASGDRWMYPFNFSSGFEISAPTFGAILEPGFDDRDSQMLVTWETNAAIPSGLEQSEYHIQRVTVRATVANNLIWRYDGTPDPTASYYPTTDPDYIADTDAGRPIELFGVGYRNSASALTWNEFSSFSTGSPDPGPAEKWRDAFAATFDLAGNATDVSNQVRERFNPAAMAIGTTDQVTPGSLVPIDTTLTFEVDLCDPATRAYFARSLSAGRLHLAITSLEPASGGPGGGSGGLYPRFYTKEDPKTTSNPLLRVSLDVEVRIGVRPDVNGDTIVDILDFLDFFGAFGAGDPFADYNADCEVDILDFLDFFEDFGAY